MAKYPSMADCSRKGRLDYEAAAQAAIRAYCGWHVAPVLTETIEVTARHCGRDLWLPSTHVLNIETVEVEDMTVEGGWRTLDPATYEWDETGLLRRCGVWPRRLRGIRVTLTHGYEPDEVPDVLAIADALQGRARMNLYGVASQSVNGASVSYQTAGGAPLSVSLLNIEKQTLDPYRVGVGRIGG